MESHFVSLLWQVDYDNHPHFKSKNMKGSKRGSPVRIFTNINPADVILPSAEGYRYRNVMFNASMLGNNLLQFSTWSQP